MKQRKQSEAGKRVAAKVVSMNYGGYKITEADREKVAEWVDEELTPLRRELRATAGMLQAAAAYVAPHSQRAKEWKAQAEKALALAQGDRP